MATKKQELLPEEEILQEAAPQTEAVALDGGIDCLCSYPKRGRPPRGSRVTVRILGINHDSNRIWGAITHIAAPR